MAAIYENERPLLGLAGILDWRLHGQISRFLLENSVQGAAGELCYLPFQKRERTLHVFLAGCGRLPHPGDRPAWPTELLSKIRKNLKTSGVTRVGVSVSDSGATEQSLSKSLEGEPFWLVQ